MRTRRRPIGRDYAAAKDAECGILKGINPDFIFKNKIIPDLAFLLKSTEYLNFRHFRHFAILGISTST
jgi:hypothetical protein